MTKDEFAKLRDGQMLVLQDGFDKKAIAFHEYLYFPENGLYRYGGGSYDVSCFRLPTRLDLDEAMAESDERHMEEVRSLVRAYRLACENQ